MDVAVSVKNLGKRYRLYDDPKHRLKEALHPFRKRYHREFWALQDVCFEVGRGETFTVIGRNGSGKSTLLQLLCGILRPTTGEVIVNGRIALLDLGTGFNPEFTGRDNVFMNGALLGFSKEELEGRFQDIADFAEIGAFIDQPVKTYSSGMYVRLAFACAIHTDPDILVIDEALAVGDARFLKKCFDRLRSFQDAGKTIILVTHDHGTARTFSRRSLLLDQGRARYVGDSEAAVLKYLQLLFPEQSHEDGPSAEAAGVPPAAGSLPVAGPQGAHCLEIVPSPEDQKKTFGAGAAWINRIRIHGLAAPNVFHGGDNLRVEISFGWDPPLVQRLREAEGFPSNLIVGCGFDNLKGVTIFGFHSIDKGCLVSPEHGEGGTITFDLTLPHLMDGSYFLYPAIALGSQEHHTQLRWYQNLIQLQCVARSKYIYGVVKLDYAVRDFAFSSETQRSKSHRE